VPNDGVFDIRMSDCKGKLDSVEIAESARKHGIADPDMIHAVTNAIVCKLQEYDEETRVLIIGPDRNAHMLEVVLVDEQIIHSDKLRPKFYKHLR
jgi:hypothetical protein